MASAIGNLLDLWEEFIDCAVENELSNTLERDILLRPNLGRIENIKIEIVFVFLFNGLDGEGPFGETAVDDSLFQVFSMEVWEDSGECHDIIYTYCHIVPGS